MKFNDTVCIDDNIVDFPFANCFTGGFRVTVSVRPSLNWVLSKQALSHTLADHYETYSPQVNFRSCLDFYFV